MNDVNVSEIDSLEGVDVEGQVDVCIGRIKVNSSFELLMIGANKYLQW